MCLFICVLFACLYLNVGELVRYIGYIHDYYVFVWLTLIKVTRVIIIFLFNLCTIVHIYVQRKDSLNNLLFEESFTRYKTKVIIACAKALKVKCT